MDTYVHYYNSLLPEEERDVVAEDDVLDLVQLNKCLDLLETDNDPIIDGINLGKTFRLLKYRKTLKYEITVDLADKALRIFYQLYTTKKTSAAQRKGILDVMNLFLKDKSKKLSFSFDWKVFWDELLDIVLRSKRSESISSVNITAELMTALLEFLHSARRLIGDDESLVIVNAAMDQLKDIRRPSMVEGVLLLNICLPTQFKHYDKYIHQWMSIWSSIHHNPTWDCCWITLFTRARKHTTTTDWTSYSSLLFSKARELIVPSERKQRSEFPFAFPEYYKRLLLINVDAKLIALNKLAKLLYFQILIGGEGGYVPAVASTISPTTAASVLKHTDASFDYSGFNTENLVHKGAIDILMFYQSIRVYINPSYPGQWTQPIAFLTTTLVSELSRHLGRNFAFSLCNSNGADPNAFQSPVHLPTIKYMLGFLTVIVMEGLYGKNPMSNFFYISCLKNLVTVDPGLSPIVIPYLVAALDPLAVTQSHQTPIALQSLYVCIKPLLFPHPFIMRYLPDILRLVLPGIDPNDQTKATSTMNLLSSIFSHIPIRADYDKKVIRTTVADGPISYLSLVSTKYGDVPNKYHEACVTPECLSVDLVGFDRLAEYWSDWLPQFFSKIFGLLEATEAKQKGRAPSPLGETISECMFILFQVIEDSSLREAVFRQVLEYFKVSTPVNAVKTCARIIQHMVASRPNSLKTVLQVLLEQDVNGLAHSSAEKLAFRLRLVCGAVRSSMGEVAECLDMLTPFLTSSFIHHSEKAVRKAASKLLKDIVKGTCAFSMKCDQSMIVGDVVGAPVLLSPKQMNWYTPEASALAVVVPFMKAQVDRTLIELTNLMGWVHSSSESSLGQNSEVLDTIPVPTEGLTLKKAEDMMATDIRLLSRLLRGSADLLGDDSSASNSGNDGNDLIDEESLHTGAERVLASLTEVDRVFLSSVRFTILRFLVSLNSALEGSSQNATTDLSAFELSATASTSLSLVGLSDSLVLRKKCMKLFKTIVAQRFHNGQNMEQASKYLKMTKRLVRPMFIRTVYREVKRIGPSFQHERGAVSRENLFRETMLNPLFWKFHDSSAYLIKTQPYILKARRYNAFANVAIRRALRTDDKSLIVGLQQLATLCGHEYDEIRAKAVKSFLDISRRFGWHRWMTEVVSPMMQAIQQPGTLYPVAAGALVLLSSSKVLDKLSMSWTLTETFLSAISMAPQMIAAVPAPDKREKLMNRLTEVVVGYISRFNHVHVKAAESTRGLLFNSLAALGFEAESGALISVPQGLVPASGIRLEAHMAWIVLHLIGHDDVELVPGLWSWSIQKSTTSHGQPVQHLALAALVRLTVVASKRGLDPTSRKILTDALIGSTVGSFGGQSAWTGLLQGISSCHAKTDPDGAGNAQWSKGVGTIMQSSTYFKSIFSRKVFSSKSDKNLYSPLFIREHVAFLETLVVLLFSDDASSLKEFVSSLLTLSKDVPSSNDEDTRCNNTTRAELFAGLYRGINRLADNDNISRDCFVGLEQLLTSFVGENVEKISSDFCKDWADAVFFAALGRRIRPGTTTCLVSFIVDGVRAVWHSNGQTRLDGDDGFARNDKRLVLGNALLQADFTAQLELDYHSDSEVGHLMMTLIADPAFNPVSQYQSTRYENFLLIACLSDLHFGASTDYSKICDLLMNAFLDANTSIGTKGAPTQMVSLSSEVIVNELGEVESSATIGEDSTDEVADGDENISLLATSEKVAILRAKHLLESAVTLVATVEQLVAQWKAETVVLNLLPLLLHGSAHPHLETAKSCTHCAVSLSGNLRPRHNLDGCIGAEFDSTVSGVIQIFAKFSVHSSIHVRRTVLQCALNLMNNCWFVLYADHKKSLKDIFADALLDDKPEVSSEAKNGMCAYLGWKTSKELISIADVYVKNSDILATREKKRRKASTETSKPDKMYMTTVMMMTCLISSFPFDLPPFMPALVAGLVKHATIPAVQDMVTKTIRGFKRSHQDRWEEYQKKFTREQLDDLQGAGAAHYFS